MKAGFFSIYSIVEERCRSKGSYKVIKIIVFTQSLICCTIYMSKVFGKPLCSEGGKVISSLACSLNTPLALITIVSTTVKHLIISSFYSVLYWLALVHALQSAEGRPLWRAGQQHRSVSPLSAGESIIDQLTQR